jgi:outer membrane protein W
MKTKITALLLLVFSSGTLFAQAESKETCIANLSTANTLYEKTQFSEAIALIEPCVKSGKLKGHLTDAYRSLALCYQQLGDMEKTNANINKLLKTSPSYQLFPFNDPKDFTKLVNEFKVFPKLYLGVKAGFTFTSPSIAKAYSIKPATLQMQSDRGQQLGLNLDYFLKGNKISINAWATTCQLQFKENVRFNEFEKSAYKQDLSLIETGVTVRYNPLQGKRLNPYIGLGVNNNYVRKGFSNLTYTNSYLKTTSESSRDLKADGLIKTNIQNAVFDIGTTFKAGKGNISIGIQYAYALTVNNNPKNRYSQVEYNLSNQWVDSDINLHYISPYLNYSFPISWRVYK